MDPTGDSNPASKRNRAFSQSLEPQQSAEDATQSETNGGVLPLNSSILLTTDDFQRIGLAPRETRLPVIRAAAMRASRTLAERQLDTPNELTERQLFQVALSTYRLLDPRQRGDNYSRAHVGRIRPGALYQAARVEFVADLVTGGNEADRKAAGGDATAGVGVPMSDGQDQCAYDEVTLGPADLPQIKPQLVRQIRHRANHPAVVEAMMIALLSTAAGLLWWGKSHGPQTRPLRAPVQTPDLNVTE
ncbi:MAG: hypothetical protein AAFV88_16610 [Planctomycetota bacterium]